MRIKKFLIFIFIIFGSFILGANFVISSDGATTVIKKSDKTDLKYRNSSESVLRLTEYTYPTQDFRGVWISNYAGDIASYANETQFKNEIKSILDTMEEYNLNAMIFHIRIHNDAMYDSSLNPRRGYWSNVNFEQFDPLTYLIEETHKRGIEFHAWLNPYRVLSGGTNNDLATYAQNFRNSYPQFPNNPAGDASMLLRNSGSAGIILNPGEPVVREHIYDTIQEIIDKYDVDAIHFDDYFYNSVNDSEDNVTYTKPGYNPKNLSKADWRRDQVNILMKGIDELLEEHFEKTGKVVQLGISPTGIYRNTLSGTNGQEHYSSLYCDSVAWIQNEWIDYLLPQTYWGLEHTAAGFAQLTRYWSSAAEGYDVNLYMGHGIYMAPGSGWENVDEIRNRFLNLEMYDRIDGSGFYKYSYFENIQSAAEQLKVGMPLLKNDYYAKKIPGSVVRSYKDLIPSIPVSNVTISKAGTNNLLLSWGAIDNVRGYVVYQTPKGVELDKNNINHLYKYIQTNAIEVPNNDNFDYYIASVNMANVISETVFVGQPIVGGVDGVIAGIETLNNPVSLSDEERINTIRSFYEALTPSEKALITNYQKLVVAEGQIVTLKEMRTALQEVTIKTSRHVINDYIFPVNTNYVGGVVSWKYKNASETVHNLVTGERNKEILSAYPVTLIASLTKGNLVYEEEVVVNFGITKIGETPLFYRNSASAMTKDEVGPYNQTSHIGWSGHTLRVDNFVFFVALNNYVKLTSTTVPAAYWHSCASLYHNVTNQTLALRLGDTAIITDVANYGYLIIDANGIVRLTSLDRNPDSIINLNPGELLLAVKYLDTQLSNPIFTPVDKISVGTYIEFTDYIALRTDPEAQAQKVINLIEALVDAEEITQATDILPFIVARDAYETLSDEAKAFVTNLAKLTLAEARIAELQAEALTLAKQAAFDLFTHYQNILDQYSEHNQQTILAIINANIPQINNATSVSQVDLIKANAKNLLEAVLTIEAEIALLNQYKDNAKDILLTYLNQLNYSEPRKQEVMGILLDAFAQIDELTTPSAIDQQVAITKGLLDQVLDIWDEAKLEVETYVADLSIYSDVDQRYILRLIERAIEDIELATTLQELNEIVATYKQRVDALEPIDYEAMRTEAKNELNGYVKLSKYTTKNKQVIQEILDDAFAKIDEATTQEAIDGIVQSAKDAIDEVPQITGGNYNCNFKATYFYFLIMAIGIVLLGIRKKRY